MKTQRFKPIGFILVCFLVMNLGQSYGQADAGDDKVTCVGTSVPIGGSPCANCCYSWSPTAGLSDPHILNPTANPGSTTTFTLTVVGQDFSSMSTDGVQVTVVPAGACCSANAATVPTRVPRNTLNAGATPFVLPDLPVLTWDACLDVASQQWRARVTQLVCGGQININPWPSQPTNMVVPNTANPVVGGNINDTIGNNNWSYVKSDMADYDNIGGGSGPHWHSTTASTAHENYHWNTDWFANAINPNWSGSETNIENLNIVASTANTQAAAKTALNAQVTVQFNLFIGVIVPIYNATNDTPGMGSGAYAAGMAVLNGLIGSTETFRLSQGW